MKTFYYTLKATLKDKTIMWWAFIFPFVLATLFNIAFAKLDDGEIFSQANIGICNEASGDKVKAGQFENMIKNLTDKNGDKMFKIEYGSEDKLKKLLADKKITGYFLYGDDIELKVGDDGIEESVLSEILRQFNCTYDAMSYTAKKDPAAALKAMKNLSVKFSAKNTTGVDSKDMARSLVYYYGLIAMSSLYTMFYGIRSSNRLNAMNSSLAQRISVSPRRKMQAVFTEFGVDMLIAAVSQTLLILYITKALRVNLGDKIGFILLAGMMGCLFAISFSIFVGMFKFKENTLVGIILAVSMVMSFLSDLMVNGIRVQIELHAPIINRLNPAAHIADAIRSLGVCGDHAAYGRHIAALCVMGIIALTAAVIKARRNIYDNL